MTEVWQVQKQPNGEVVFTGESWEEANEVAHVLVRTRGYNHNLLIVVGLEQEQKQPRPTSAGLMEAAEIAEEWDSGWGEDRNTKVARQTAIEIAEAIRARAADRSTT
jgi:hypothetical protein